MDVRDLIKTKRVILDGGMGSLLQERGLAPGELPERWNISHSDVIAEIHSMYISAGSDIITANTFGLNSLKYSSEEMKAIAFAALKNARAAGAKLVAYDMGPCGRMLKPWGDLDFEDAVSIFKEQAVLAETLGYDLVIIETMADSYETKAALLAVKESTDLPVIVSNAYGSDGKLLTGAGPKAMVAMLEGLGADAIGANCSLGPAQLKSVVNELAKYASVPVFVQPNAGLPSVKDGKTFYDISPDEFADITASMADFGVSIFGGCCGTGPEHIKLLAEKLKAAPANISKEKNISLVSSYAACVEISSSLDGAPVIVGERINPSGNKELKEAIQNQNIDYILKLGLEQEDAGAHILDVNMGVPGTDEPANLKKSVFEMQAVSACPLSIDSSDAAALEAAVRIYNGKPLINSVNGKDESLNTVLPIAAKYGGVLVCLCLDESGIHEKAEGRFAIAERIVKKAAELGIKKKDLIFDALTMPVSAKEGSAIEIIKTMDLIKNRLGCNTILGVSNISFGLPGRQRLNAAFFSQALEHGLSAGIVNPLSKDMMSSYYSFLALHGYDKGFEKYINYMDGEGNDVPKAEIKEAGSDTDLKNALIKGLKALAGNITKSLLESRDALDIINSEIIPALDFVGKAYEEKRLYLPQLLLSAEAAQAAFSEIKSRGISGSGSDTGIAKSEKFVIATVKGDIHDIGKNIVKLILSNYGFDVIDLGKDVSKEQVLKAVKESGAELCGLSALMTTTVPAMKDTIELLKKEAPACRVIVGGAVLTKEYAQSIGADYYARDAMDTVNYAKRVTAQ